MEKKVNLYSNETEEIPVVVLAHAQKAVVVPVLCAEESERRVVGGSGDHFDGRVGVGDEIGDDPLRAVGLDEV